MEPLAIHYVFSLKIRGSLVIHYDFGNSGRICSTVLQIPLELRLTQIDSNRFKSVEIDSCMFCSTKIIDTKIRNADLMCAFTDLLLMSFVLQNLPESIFADSKRFESICVSLNSRGTCSTVLVLV